MPTQRSAILRTIMEEETARLLEELNQAENPLHDDRDRPYFEWDINCGNCDTWADRVVDRLRERGITADAPGSENFRRFQDLPNHVFVRVGRRYYDCECLDGVTRVMDLPLYSRNVTLSRDDARRLYPDRSKATTPMRAAG